MLAKFALGLSALSMAAMAAGAAAVHQGEVLLPLTTFSYESDAMLPGIPRDVFVTTIPFRARFASRGDRISVRHSADPVLRIAGLPGDTVQLVAGHVVINGKLIELVNTGEAPVRRHGRRTRTYYEQFPGEQTPHRILDSGRTAGDRTPPVKVPANRFFVLGDNRDVARDSRFPATGRKPRGVGLVAVADVAGAFYQFNQ